MDKDKYPQMIYAYAILLDNKIENWKVSKRNRKSVYYFCTYWKFDRINDYKLQKTGWLCKNNEDVIKVFEELAPKWLKTWKHAGNYVLNRAY